MKLPQMKRLESIFLISVSHHKYVNWRCLYGLWAFHVLPASPLLGWIFDITEKNVICIEDAVLWQPGDLTATC